MATRVPGCSTGHHSHLQGPQVNYATSLGLHVSFVMLLSLMTLYQNILFMVELTLIKRDANGPEVDQAPRVTFDIV